MRNSLALSGSLPPPPTVSLLSSRLPALTHTLELVRRTDEPGERHSTSVLGHHIHTRPLAEPSATASKVNTQQSATLGSAADEPSLAWLAPQPGADRERTDGRLIQAQPDLAATSSTSGSSQSAPTPAPVQRRAGSAAAGPTAWPDGRALVPRGGDGAYDDDCDCESEPTTDYAL